MSSLASITRVTELSHDNSGVTERDHRAYVSVFRAITAFQLNYCVASPVSALSTSDYPEESIKNTMVVKKSIISWGYYWSSKGSDDPGTPYKLTSAFCVVTDI
ncbi:hypothetical protein HanOQP8_Chr00c008g0684681 [Helianthus annuus]|nr:hypothetical protein HanOQP8_Chr00c008g0684681 [Helianthus annuus]